MNVIAIKPVPDLSVVICVLDRLDDPAQLLGIYRAALEPLGACVEFIYMIADAHPRIEEVTALGGPDVTVAHLPRLCGETSMLREGVRSARAEHVMILPPYLQVAPDVLPGLVQALDGSDMVAASRIRAQDSFLNRARANAFRGATRLTGTSFDDLGCRVRVLKRSLFDRLVLQEDQVGYLPIFAEHAGFRVKQVRVPQAELDRKHRSYNLRTYFDGLLDALSVSFLIRFLQKPFRLFGAFGAVLMASGLVLAVVLVAEWFTGQSIAERPALLLSVLLIVLGIQVAAVGLIAEVILFTRLPAGSTYRIARIIERVGEASPRDAPVDSAADASVDG